MTPDELLTTTRAVRLRLDLTRPVPVEEIEACLRIAQQAPSGTGSYTPHWLVITDPATRAALGRVYRMACDDYVLPPAEPGDKARQRYLVSANYLADHLGEVPALVLACLDTGGPLPAGNQASLWGVLLPAVWSYQLAARSRGLGTVWTTQHLRRHDQVARILDIPPGVHQAALIPTAYHLGTTFHPARRPPLVNTLHVDRW